MGGCGAMKLALAYPDVFAAAASHSGVVSRLLVERKLAQPPQYATAPDSLNSRRSTRSAAGSALASVRGGFSGSCEFRRRLSGAMVR